MPFSVGNSELRIVPFQDLGQLGPRDGKAVVFPWRWYYNVPSLPLWGILLLLLLVPKANRRREAWLILIPLVLVLLVCRMLATLFSLPDGATDTIGFFVLSVAMAWTMVWLLGGWLGTRYRIATFIVVMAVMMAIGLVSYYCHYQDSGSLVPSMIGYAVIAASLPLAMLLASFCCRRKFSPLRFRLWLPLWMLVAVMGVAAVYLAILMAFIHPGILAVVSMIVGIGIGSLVYAGVLYLLNLPFQELAFRCPFYRARFEELFRIEKRPKSSPDVRSRRKPSDLCLHPENRGRTWKGQNLR